MFSLKLENEKLKENFDRYFKLTFYNYTHNYIDKAKKKDYSNFEKCSYDHFINIKK